MYHYKALQAYTCWGHSLEKFQAACRLERARVRGASFSLGGLVPYRRNDLSRSSPPDSRDEHTGMQERRAKIL